jgi:predicted dehydrogenase
MTANRSSLSSVKHHRSDQVRVAVVGVGHFGQFHAKHYSLHKRAKLVAVVDIDQSKALRAAAQTGGEPTFDYRDLIGRVDAASIVVPTPQHFEIARELLEAGIHLLIEKPLTDDLVTATSLAGLAKQRELVLQVGHIERFSAAYRTLRGLVTRPLYFESYRISPWKDRGNEVDVVFDLMIHDIDIVLGLAESLVISVDAVGAPLFNETSDIANARVNFQSGCVANITASRVSHKTERRLRVFQPNSYLVCDFAENRIIGSSLQGSREGRPLTVSTTSFDVPEQDSLANEIDHFLECVAIRGKPVVDAWAGCEAMRVASMIAQSMAEHHRRAGTSFANG